MYDGRIWNKSPFCLELHGTEGDEDDLNNKKYIGIIIFVVGLIAFIGNVVVLVSKSKVLNRSRRTMSKVEKIYASMVLSLSMADLLMGVYCIILETARMSKDFKNYCDKLEWKLSSICTALGVINFISSQVSVTTLVIISSVRIISFAEPFKRIKLKVILYTLIFTWIVWVVISFLPVLTANEEKKNPFYGSQTVCTMAYIVGKNDDHMPLTLFVLFYNLIAFLFILLLQLGIYYKTLSGPSSFLCNCCTAHHLAVPAAQSHRQKEDANMHRRLFFIVLTDFLCWIPLTAISLYIWSQSYVQLGYEWRKRAKEMKHWFSDLLIIFIPINSALNPVLYSSKFFCKNCHHVCKIPTCRHLKPSKN
ncbi:relaxin receptor 1-like [Clavelina lepadiformis]|uniref:relaxin receptor 1-like n=1 Tax=Clavelina lepadiformis TaxID=159417 RepID=UPI0040422946